MRARFLLMIVIALLAEVYSFILIRSATRNLPQPWRNIWFGLYLLVTAFTWLGIIFFRKIDWAHLPHMARNLYVAFTLGFFVGKILILLVLLIDDIRRVFLWVLFKLSPETKVPVSATSEEGISRSGFLKTVALVLGGTSVAVFLYGITNRYSYQIKRVKLRFKNLPEAFSGLKIVQISDIHTGSFDNKEAVAKGVDMILKEKPDIVFFTGDLVNNKAEELVPYKALFSKIKAPLGVYSTLGNHDYGDYYPWNSMAERNANLHILMQNHGEMGWRLMMNEHILLEKNGEQIALLGVENWSAKAGFPKYGDLRKAYGGPGLKKIPFKILLTHDPSHFDAEVTQDFQDIDLTLSGHTHGMQFGVEIPGFKWSPSQYVYRRWAGLYQSGSQFLYVNRGFGFLGYPGRVGILPEITVIELERG